jgi:4-hydroxyphenylpyruvate dioxygenase
MTDTDTLSRAKDMAARDDMPLKGFSHLEWWVGNAYQTAHFFRHMHGFDIIGYRGPETGSSRETASYLLAQGDIRFIVTGAMTADHPVSQQVLAHGPGVHDVAISVPDAEAAFETAVERGADPATKPHVLEDDRGRMVVSAIAAYGDTIHSFVERDGDFPGFEPLSYEADPIGLQFIDHVVANVELGKMDYWVEFYERVFGFTMLKHFDDDAISTKYTALMSKVMWDGTGIIKLPINEPAEGLKRSQIDEYLQFYGSAGVQHIAMHTQDLVATVTKTRSRGLDTLAVPATYYEDLWARMPDIDVDRARIEELDILADQDEGGYLLQIFTRMLQDRPTVFFEFIERRGATGFGKGNFKALFEAIEREQEKRGNL